MQTVMPRQVEQFRIKPESLDALLLEKDCARFAAEGFEPALRVYKRQSQDNPDDRVEDDACELSKSRFMHGDEASVERARAYRHIVRFQGLEKLGRFLD